MRGTEKFSSALFSIFPHDQRTVRNSTFSNRKQNKERRYKLQEKYFNETMPSSVVKVSLSVFFSIALLLITRDLKSFWRIK
jgi:hypothetical protein